MTAPRAPVIDKASEPADLRRERHRGLFRLRVAEKLILGFLAYLALAAWFFPVDTPQRWLILATNGLACVVVAALGRFDQPVPDGSPPSQDRPPRRVLTLAPLDGSQLLAEVRHWLPLALILVAYRESGLFVRPDLSHRLDQLFVVWDRAILGNAWTLRAIAASGPWLTGYLEIAYLFCYPLVPIGLAAVLIRRRRIIRSFVQSGDRGHDEVRGADTVVATVLLRYHYSADTLAGAAVAVAAALVSRRIHAWEAK